MPQLFAYNIPHVLVESFVLGLFDEAHLVAWKSVWIHHTLTSSVSNLSKDLVPVTLTSSQSHLLVWVTVRGVTRIVNHVLVTGTCLAHIQYGAVGLSQFARNSFNRVNVSYFCHSFVFGNRIALTDDYIVVEATDASTLKSKSPASILIYISDCCRPRTVARLPGLQEI